MTDTQPDYDAQADAFFSNGIEGPMNPPSDKQVAYVLGLQDERDLPDEYIVLTEEQLRRLERHDVSDKIQTLQRFKPRTPTGRNKPAMPDIPAGKYALKYADGWRFFDVSKPGANSRWNGYTFVSRLTGAPGQFQHYPIRGPLAKEIAEAIAVNPKTASTDFGKHVGVCGICGSPLTNEESRALGIGPICARKRGW